MDLEIRGVEKYPMTIFWNGEVWLDIVPAGYSGIAQWKAELRAAGYCIGTIKRPH